MIDFLTTHYADTPEFHQSMWDIFTTAVNSNPALKAHRDYIEANDYGYGDRPYHYLWWLLVNNAPKDFRFLEIGVFQGQTLSLVSLLSRELGKEGKITGITPLSGAGDAYKTHADLDYLEKIKTLYRQFNAPSGAIVKGMSYDPRVQKLAREDGPYDLLYIDGCHDYAVVVDDIREYAPMVKPGGYLVMDDCGNDLNLPTGLNKDNFKGLDDVSRAVKHELLDLPVDLSGMKFVFSIGHNRVFKKV